MAACNATARGARRSGERGATLTVIAFVSGLSLLALGTVYLAAAEKAYTYTGLRTREAQLRAAADAGLVQALEALKHGQNVNAEYARDGARVKVATTPGARVRVTVIAESGSGNDALRRAFSADVDFGGSGGAPRVLKIQREGL